MVQAVGQGRCGGLVDDAADIQPGNAPGILGGLALDIIKVGGNGDDGVRHRMAQIFLCVRLQFLKDHGADLLRGAAAAPQLQPAVGAHLPLDGGDGAFCVGDGLALGQVSHQAFSVLGKGHHGRRGAVTLCICDDNGLVSLQNSDTAVGRAQVDPDNGTHSGSSCLTSMISDRAAPDPVLSWLW